MVIRLLAALVWLAAVPAFAQDFGKLISPGELSTLHAEAEGLANCAKCHALTGGIPDSSCVECHKDIGARVQSGKGLHAKAAAEGKKCFQCHSDHKGKSFNMVSFDTKEFEHSQTNTGYVLDGKHIKADCAKCHTAKTAKGVPSFLLKDSACRACHQDVHKGALGADCERCHNANSWKGADVRFDHAKTRYPLDGKHEKAACAKCHVTGAVFKVAGFEKCVTCHKKEDVHKNSLGETCENCHKTSSWKEVRFDHAKTKYPLEAKHAAVPCAGCHQGAKRGEYKVAKYDTCGAAGCHDTKKRGHIHGNQFAGRRCEECHSVKGWKPALFRHDSPAYKGYKLEGKHSGVECGKCHATSLLGEVRWRPLKSDTCDASGCHDTKPRGYIHGAQFKGQRCDSCHEVKGWKPALFRHDGAEYKGYKLRGKHAQVACDKCHKPGPAGEVKYKPVETKSCDTSGCHADPHRAQFRGKACDSCHVEEDWKKLTFDHASGSRFALRGKHSTAACDKCHLNKLWKPLATECKDCHQKDDKHKGAFGQRCGECHGEDTWKTKKFIHRLTGFKLDGAHAGRVCSDCHTAPGYAAASPACGSCHTDAHLNQFGEKCEDCHNAFSWEPVKFNHSLTGFRLEGAHRATPCRDCHTDRFYRGAPTDCYACHSADFFSPAASAFHSPLNTNCADCHKVYSWTPAAGHKHTSMTFTGAHRAVEGDCAKCHTGGSSQLLFPGADTEGDCEFCHMADYAKEHANGRPAGVPACPQTCSLCHNTGDFDNAKEIIRCD